jgi:CheY-like chemotaxis protein/anti-sigma regulatory factor (Ser/Thr protein kinase)
LQQVLWNLLSNAVKFTPEGGQITVALTQAGTHAQIQVTDTGKGINPDFLPYVFEHFRQEDGATTRKFGGLGLGLAIVRHLVEVHGGTVQVESPGVGQGATFTVKLPLPRNEDCGTRDEQIPVSLTHSVLPLSNVQVLVVDDEVDTRELIAFVLEQAGAIVTAVPSAIAVLEVLAQGQPDVLISDIGMPQMDGYMLMQQIRAMSQQKPILSVALTAYAGESDRHQTLAAGFQRHVSKPIEPELLVQTIVSLIGQGSVSDETKRE